MNAQNQAPPGRQSRTSPQPAADPTVHTVDTAQGASLTPIEAAGLKSWLDDSPQRLLTRRFREAEAALAMCDALGVAFQALARLR